MARLRTLGAELNTITGGVEIDGAVGSGISLATSNPRSELRGYVGTANSTNNGYVRFDAGTPVGPYYASLSFVYDVLPAAACKVMVFASISVNDSCSIRITTTGTLTLNDAAGTQVGSASAALVKGTRYCLELYFFDNAGSGFAEMEAKLDGSVFATTTTNANNSNVNGLYWGNGSGDTTFRGHFDDILVNDNTGGSQTSYPGKTSKIAYLRPNAPGTLTTEFATKTGGVTAGHNLTRVVEVTPDDATSFNGSNTADQEDMFKFDVAKIPSGSTINVIEVHGRFRNNTADAATAIKYQIRKVTGGTTSQSAAIIPNSTTWSTNSVATPFISPLILYNDPDGNPWTKESLATMEAGYIISTGGTNRIEVTKLWVVVDYTPPTTSQGFLKRNYLKPHPFSPGIAR